MATPEEILRQRLAAQPSLASLVPQSQPDTLQQIASGQPMDIGLPPPPNPMMPQVPQEAFNQAYDQINPPVPAIEAERQRSAQEDSWGSRALQRGFWTYGPGTVGGMVGWFGSAINNDAIKDAGLRLHQYSAERAYMRPRDVKGVGYIHGVGDTAKWAGEAIIEFFPQMVAMALGAKGMQMAGNKALSTQTGREAADALLGTKISKEASKLTARGVDPEVATSLARKRLQDQALIRLGAGLQVGGAYTGSSWAEVLQEHGVDDPSAAAMVGAGAGALTMLMGGQVAAVEAVLGRSSAAQFAKALNTNNQNVLTRIASEFAKVAPPAMLEEYAQESMALLNLIYHDPDVANTADAMVDEYMRNIGRPVESALTVGVAAGVPGAIARGTLTPRAQPEATTSDPDKEAVVSAATSPTPTQGVKQPIAKEYDDLGPFVKPATGDNQIEQGSIIAPLSGKGRPLTVVGLTEAGAVISDQQTKQVSVVPLQELVKKYGVLDHQGWLDAAQRELPLTGGQGTKPSVPKSVKLPGKEISREEIVYPTREEALRHAAVGEQPVQVAGGWQLQTTQLDLIAHPQIDRDVLIARGVPKGIAVKLMDMSLEEANDWVTRQEQRAMADGREPGAAIDAARSVIEDMRRNQDAIGDAAITKPEAVIPTPDNEARPGQLDLPLPDMGPLPYRGVDRRRDPERRKSVAQMSDQERVTELLVDRQTGLWNKRAWEEADRKPYQIFIDLDGLKWVNDNMGHEAGDQFLALMGDAVRSVSPDGHHFSGDEFVIQANTPEEAQALVDQLYVIAEGMQVTGKTKGGKEGSRPLRFSYGIGESLEEADRNMLAHKEQRAQQGLRAERGTTAAADMATTDAGQMELFADPVAAPVVQEPTPVVQETAPVVQETAPIAQEPVVAEAPVATPVVQETAPIAQEPVVAEAPVEPAPAPRPRRERVQRAKTAAAIAPEPLDAELTPAIADDPFAQVSEEEALRAEMQQPARADALGALLDRPRTLRDLKHNVVQSIDELPAEIQAMLGGDMAAVQVGDTMYVVADRIRGPRTMQVMQLRSAVVRSRGPAWLFRGLWAGVLDFFEGSVDNVRKSLTTIAEGGEDALGLQLLEAIRIQARERGLWSEIEVSAAEAVSYFSNTDDARSYTPKMAMKGAKVTGSGISRSVLDRSLQPFLAKGYKIVVEETPPATAPDAKGGITDDGTIYLYRSMISDRADLLRVLRHELVGHLGMRAVVGEGNWGSIKRAVLSSTDSRIRDLLLEVERRYPGESVNTQVNEVFAIAAERDPDGNIFTRLWGVIRAALRRAGLVTGEMTWSELQGMLMASSIASKIAPSLVRGAQSSGMLAGENARMASREREVDPNFAKFTELTDAVEYIESKGDPFYSLVAKRIMPYLHGATFTVVESDTYDEVVKRFPPFANAYGIQTTDKSQGIDGVWVRGESLDGPGITDAIVLHEALHQATARKIALYTLGEVRAVDREDTISDASEMRRAYDDLVRLRDHVVEEYMRQRNAALKEGRDIGIDVMKMYVAVSDLGEMVSYGFTDKDIHDFMKSIPGVLKGRSAWDEFVDAIRRLFGIPESHSNAFMDLVDITNRIMYADIPFEVRGIEQRMVEEGRASTILPHRMMYSRGDTQVHTPTPEEKFDRMMPAALSNTFGLKPGGMDWRSIFDGVKAAALPYILKVAPLMDVGEVFGNQFRTTWRGRAVDFVREYQRLMQEQSRVTDGRRVQAFHTVQQWADMTGEAAKKLNAALEFATLRNLRLGLPVERQPWTLEQWEESGNLKRFGYLDENVKEMNRLWSQVPESHKKVWREADQDMGRMFDEVKDAVKNMVSRNLGDSDRAAMVLKAIDQKYQKLKGTYVPLMRFGDYGVAEYTFDEELGQWTKTADFRYDTAAKALNEFERMRKGKDPEKVRYQQYSQLEALEQRLSPMDTSIFQSIRNAVEQALGGSDVPPESVRANVDTIMGMVSDLFIEDLPERAFAHHEQHRSGMPGYSTDFARSYENYILRGSAVLGAVRYGSQRTALLRDMKDFLIASRSPDFQAPEGFKPYHAAAVYNSLVEREATLTMNPGWVVPSLSKLTFLQLLTSPSQWLVNLSQVPLVWLPLAAGRWGMSKASSVMTNTMRDAMGGKYKADRILADDVTEHVNKIFARNPETDEFLLTKDQRDREIDKLPTYMQELVALRQLADSGKMQLGYAHALLAGAEHGHDTIAGSWGRTVDSVMHYVSFFMRHSEEVNRKVSMLGAFRLARQQGKKFTDALEDGFYFTDRSQYDYTRQNRVPLLKHGAARLMLQVQSFRIMTLAMLASEAYKAFRNGDREAARALGWLQGTSALIAGIRGMPVYGLGMLLMSALQALGIVGDEEDPKDFNMEVELGLRGMFGDRLGTGISRGIPAMFGMDLHSRTQLANLHESSMMSPPESLTGAARANWQAAVLIGPAWNNVVNFHKLTQALDRGDPMLKAAGELLPKPMKDAINTSYILFDEEPIRGAGGRAILEAQQVGGYPLLLMGLGIMPTVVTTRKIEDRYVNDRATVIGQTRTRIVAHLSRAIIDNDAQAIEEWEQRAIDFNNRNPAYGIMGGDLRASITQRYKKDLGIPTDNYIYEAQRTLGGQYQPIPSMM